MSAPFFRGGYLSVSARGGGFFLCVFGMDGGSGNMGVGFKEIFFMQSACISPKSPSQNPPALLQSVCGERMCVFSFLRRKQLKM